ncbi:MAG: YncE family protein [Nitrosopumilus sp.]|nr:YncE family protein [Nitrosopumilus sp.]
METIGTVELENGEYFVTLDEKSNTVYVSNNKSDSILIIDGNAKKTVNRIEIERPRELVLNSDNNTLYVISGNAGFWLRDNGAKISVINLATNQIIDSIGKKEGFGDIKLNQKTKSLYATQTNSKKVWVIDTLTNVVKEQIKVGGKYRSIAIDKVNNMIYLAGRERFDDKMSFAVIDGKNDSFEKITSKMVWSGKKVWELYYNQVNNKLYAFVEQSRGENTFEVFIQSIDLESRSFGQKTESRGVQDGMGFDESRNRFYFSDVQKGEFSVLNYSLEEIGLFRFTEPKGFVEKHFKGHGYHSKFAVNSDLQLIYIAGSKMNLLHIIKE